MPTGRVEVPRQVFDLLAGLALGYLFGSFPSAAVLARLSGHDIFEVGSGNMGAMNTARNIGWLAGVGVLLLDVVKGAVPVLLAQLLSAGSSEGVQLSMPLAAGVGAVAGHAWSAFARFRGGKALATTLGVALPVYPLAAIYTMLLLIGLVLVSRRTTFSSVVAMAVYPAILMVVLARSGVVQEQAFAILTSVIVISAIVIFKHLRPLIGQRAA